MWSMCFGETSKWLFTEHAHVTVIDAQRPRPAQLSGHVVKDRGGFIEHMLRRNMQVGHADVALVDARARPAQLKKHVIRV